MADLAVVTMRLQQDRNLAVLVTTRPDQLDPQVSVVNVGVIGHPVTTEPVAALVGRPGAKLVNLRATARATLVVRAGWEWVAVRGPVELAGPDDPHPDIPAGRVATLLQAVYVAAGGEHQDLAEYDRVMVAERRCVVLIHPERVWSNPPGAQHLDPEPAT